MAGEKIIVLGYYVDETMLIITILAIFVILFLLVLWRWRVAVKKCDKLADATSGSKDLLVEVDRLREENQELTQSNLDINKELETTKSELETEKKKIGTEMADISKEKETLEREKLKISTLNEEIELLREKIASLENEKKQMVEAHNTEKEKLDEKLKEWESIAGNLIDMKTNVEGVESELKTLLKKEYSVEKESGEEKQQQQEEKHGEEPDTEHSQQPQ